MRSDAVDAPGVSASRTPREAVRSGGAAPRSDRLLPAALAWVAGAAALTPLLAQAQCLLPVGRATLVEVTHQGQAYLAAPKEYVDQLECLDVELLDADEAMAAELDEILRRNRELNEELAERIREYQALIDDYDADAVTTRELVEDYDRQVSSYDELAESYKTLTANYSDLVDEYRDIAINAQTGISLSAGVGVNDSGDPAALVGVGFNRLRVWGTVNEEESAVYLGGSFRF